MKRLIPHPVISLGLLLMWMMLTKFSLGHLVLGSAVSIGAGKALSTVLPEAPRIARPLTALRLIATVIGDIVTSNVAVARRIIGRTPQTAQASGFVMIPLRLRDPSQLLLLALIVTATPGSVWVDFDPDSGDLTLHVLEMGDTDWVALVRDRYEQPLMEIFG